MVGHVEVVEFARVERVPRPGEIVTARETWTEAAGGGADAAYELLRLAGNATFFTALGHDNVGHAAEQEIRATGIRLECVYREAPQRRGFTYLDEDGERTITMIGSKLVPYASDPLPWHELEDAAAVYFCGGDAGALREARRARVLVATARELATLREAGVELDVLIQSGSDEAERYTPGELDPAPRMVVTTEAENGGHYRAGDRSGRWEAAPLPGALVDSYGAGDAFAAGLAFGLGAASSIDEALAVAARSAAAALTRPGAGAPA